MTEIASPPPPLNLHALRGAVGDVVGAAGCWGQLVWIWRIMGALDGLIAVLWAIVHRLRAGEALPRGECPEAAARCERPVMAGSGPVRLRAVVGARALPERRVPAAAVASAGRVRRGARRQVEWRWPDRVSARMSAVLVREGRGFSDLGGSAAQSCVLIVPV